MSSPNFRRGRGRSSRSHRKDPERGISEIFVRGLRLFATQFQSFASNSDADPRAEGCGDLGGTAAREAGVSSLRQARFALSAPTPDWTARPRPLSLRPTPAAQAFPLPFVRPGHRSHWNIPPSRQFSY
jgi:hypothetical protein